MPSIHLLTGTDDLLLQRATERLLAKLSSDDPDLVIERHEASQLEALPALRTPSLFGGRTCAVLRGVQAASADVKHELEAYLSAPDGTAVLVLVAEGTGRIQKVARLAREHGEVTRVETPADWKTREWQQIVTGEFQRAARRATSDAVAAVLEHAGLDPSAIAMRVAQVVAGTDATTITADHVDELVEGHGRRSNFELADAIADRDAARTLILTRGALESGEAPLALAGAITYRFRQLQQVRGGVAPPRMSSGQRTRTEAIARRNFGTGELAWCLDRLAQLDVDLKGHTDLPSELAFELAVIDLATPRAVGAPWNPMAAVVR